MRVFVTGATGFIGAALVPELIGAGHEVLGLSRSEANAASLRAAGARVHRGSLEEPESLRAGAAAADAVIHLAFDHDFTKFEENCATERRAIETLGAALAGSDRPLLVTSGTAAVFARGRAATEEDASNAPFPRVVLEQAALALAARGVRVALVRVAQVHDRLKQGLITYLIATARQTGVSAYVGEGLNRWPAVHRLDAARLYRLALEKNTAGAVYHAVGEEGVPMKRIAETIGSGLKLPVVARSSEEAAAHFGWMALFAGADIPASSALTQQRLGWRPAGPGLLADLAQARDFAADAPAG